MPPSTSEATGSSYDPTRASDGVKDHRTEGGQGVAREDDPRSGGFETSGELRHDVDLGRQEIERAPAPPPPPAGSARPGWIFPFVILLGGVVLGALIFFMVT